MHVVERQPSSLRENVHFACPIMARSDTVNTMFDFQAEKTLVREHHAAIAAATPATVGAALAARTKSDWAWRGTHPFGPQVGARAVAAAFWTPLIQAFTRMQRRPDIFLAGEAKGTQRGVWVVETGHLMGLFDRALLGIRPTRRIAMLRYVEFNRVADGQITDTVMFADLLSLMWQAGQYPLPPATGAHLITPGPMTHAGLLHGPQDPARGLATMAAIEALLNNAIAAHDPQEAAKLARVWHDDMIWWGPAGIGASYTIDRYVAQHCKPFDDGLTHVPGDNGDLTRVAEGDFGGFFAWDSYRLRGTGGYLGMTATENPAAMPFVDLYRVEDGKLIENWVFIDLLGMLFAQGLDVLGRLGTTQN